MRFAGLSLPFVVLIASVARGQSVDHRTAGPFHVQAEFALASIEPVLGELAEIQSQLQHALSVPPADQPVQVYLFGDERAYRRAMQARYPDLPARRAMYIQSAGAGRVFAYRGRDLSTDLRHEATHALLHAVLPMVPLWLDEGLAEYFEVPADKRVKGNPHLRSLTWSLRLGSAPSLEALEQIGSLADMTQTDYRNAWAWVHFMLHGPPQARQELIAFLADIRAGTPPGLLSQRLNLRMGDRDVPFVEHFRERQW